MGLNERTSGDGRASELGTVDGWLCEEDSDRITRVHRLSDYEWTRAGTSSLGGGMVGFNVNIAPFSDWNPKVQCLHIPKTLKIMSQDYA